VESQTPETILTESVAELIALASSMASNNQEAFQHHNFRLHKLGVSREDRIQAVNIALQIKMGPHRTLVEMAEGFLVGAGASEGGCCSGCGGSEEGGCSDEGCGCSEEGSCCGGDEGCGCGHD
jgi:hypothetical protein